MTAHHARNSFWFAIPCSLLSRNRDRRIRRSPTTATSDEHATPAAGGEADGQAAVLNAEPTGGTANSCEPNSVTPHLEREI